MKKKRADEHITPLRPATLASFLTWGIHQELVVCHLPERKDTFFIELSCTIFRHYI